MSGRRGITPQTQQRILHGWQQPDGTRPWVDAVHAARAALSDGRRDDWPDRETLTGYAAAIELLGLPVERNTISGTANLGWFRARTGQVPLVWYFVACVDAVDDDPTHVVDDDGTRLYPPTALLQAIYSVKPGSRTVTVTGPAELASHETIRDAAERLIGLLKLGEGARPPLHPVVIGRKRAGTGRPTKSVDGIAEKLSTATAAWRRASGISRRPPSPKELAHHAGVSVGTVYRWQALLSTKTAQ